VIGYKFLRSDGTSLFTGFRWPLPEDGEPGSWVEATRGGPEGQGGGKYTVDPCRSGIHACRPADLPPWIGEILYEVELAGEIVELTSKVVAARGRLLRRIEAWDDRLRDAYTRMCADRAHEIARGGSPLLDHWDVYVERSVPEGPALLGFVAARIGEERWGRPAYRAERARQAEWLVEHLGLPSDPPA
jgi:hypothetical protein